MTKKQIIVSGQEVNEAIDAMAAKVATDFKDERPLFVALLRGAAPFASRLMFSIQRQFPNFHPELDYMMVSTYGGGQTAGEPRIVTDLGPDTLVNGRAAVIVDDILDKGITAEFVKKHLESRGAALVKVAVLVNKKTPKSFPVTADYCGFELEDLWLVGMGMDDAVTAKEHARWQWQIEAVVE